jgi:acetyltransferase-like isoleucine patch superfamily enzyme
VNEDVEPYAIVAGVPARFIRWRDGYRPDAEEEHGTSR